MTQLGEAIKAAQINKRFAECPFQVPPPDDDPTEEDENHAKDDLLTMATAQANSGGILGDNVKADSPGAQGTWNRLGGKPFSYEEDQVDTGRKGVRVVVRDRPYDFTVAAHHLIPGNASLYKSALFKSYMRRGGKMKLTKPTPITFTVTHNIGYNVNGSHNGVWLPGSYAVREGVHPSGLTWGLLIEHPTHKDWCYDYMAAVAKKAAGQFHDAHTFYNKNALKVLNQLAVKLMKHQQVCKPCRKKKDVPPPYEIKKKLYLLSRYFRGQAKGPPGSWKLPWVTSDQVHTDVMSVPERRAAFLATYKKSAI